MLACLSPLFNFKLGPVSYGGTARYYCIHTVLKPGITVASLDDLSVVALKKTYAVLCILTAHTLQTILLFIEFI